MAEPQEVGYSVVPVEVVCEDTQQSPCCQGLSRRVHKVQRLVDQFTQLAETLEYRLLM
jgi:hypothetical protein